MSNAPEQSIVDQLEAAGYKPETIISYLEARVEKEWQNADFQECAQGERMVFGVCRKIGDTQEQPKPEGQGAGGEKPKKQEKSAQEEKLEAAAKAQGSSPDNNKKVVIDGKAYGWAIQNGKPIMVEWGAVAGIKKVGPGKSGRGGRGGGGDNAGRIAGLKKALEKQTTEAGRRAIQKQIDELTRGSGSSSRGGGGGGDVGALADRARDAWNRVPKEGRTPENAARYAAAVATAQAADKALQAAERAAMPRQPRQRGV